MLENRAPDEPIRAVRAAHAGDAHLSPAWVRQVLGMVRVPDDRGREAQAPPGRRGAVVGATTRDS